VTALPLTGTDLRRLRTLPLTYAQVGQSAGTLPPGFRHVEMTRSLGVGRLVYEEAAHLLMTWQMHQDCGLTVHASATEVRPGTVVVLGVRRGPFRLSAPCRVVRVVDEVDRCGFAYGTLPGHPESGEESFMVSIGADGRVAATIRAFSRPASLLARLGGPLSRHVQDRYTRAYLTALGGHRGG